MHTVLIGLCFVSMFLYFFMFLVEKKPHWFQSRTTSKLNELEERYNKAKNSRKETLHHYYWSESNGETQKKAKMEHYLIRIDEELASMRKYYQLLEEGKLVPLKKV